ncbi:MAG: helix-turn-helix transcriptional regulator [Lachnospiraceae bacterium]|nr:helix-turn-helix transcriptional regulator [Lachnospiraceae bacterium]
MKIYGTENNYYILKEIGKRIKDTRIVLSMTQKDMALKAGVAPKTIERIENGENVKIENLLNVLRVLNLLQNFEILVPEQEFLTQEEHSKKRQRASKKRVEDKEASGWKWGDEL